jgi:hypothetical protein
MEVSNSNKVIVVACEDDPSTRNASQAVKVFKPGTINEADARYGWSLRLSAQGELKSTNLGIVTATRFLDHLLECCPIRILEIFGVVFTSCGVKADYKLSHPTPSRNVCLWNTDYPGT